MSRNAEFGYTHTHTHTHTRTHTHSPGLPYMSEVEETRWRERRGEGGGEVNPPTQFDLDIHLGFSQVIKTITASVSVWRDCVMCEWESVMCEWESV